MSDEDTPFMVCIAKGSDVIETLDQDEYGVIEEIVFFMDEDNYEEDEVIPDTLIIKRR